MTLDQTQDMTLAENDETLQNFEPNPGVGKEFREALAQFGTGVTVVTTMGADGPIGITANSFSSVSLDPPLVLWSASRTSRRFADFVDTSHLAIHVLAHDQSQLCWDFSRAKDAFHSHPWHQNEHGTPLIDGCLARFECEKYADYDGGDHAIIVSRVTKMSFRKGDPLLFFDGDVGRFTRLVDGT